MAVLGVQLVLTMVMASFLQKLSPHFSFARWLLCNHLVRYLHPTDEELKTAAGVPQSYGKQNKNRRDRRHENEPQVKIDTFSVPKNIDIKLECTKVSPIDLLPLQFYAEFQWLVDFSVCALFVYSLTEIYLAWFPYYQEFNLSVLWCLLIVVFALKCLFSLTAMYFRIEDSGEKILCVTFTFFFLTLSMGTLITSEDILEFGLEPAHATFKDNAQKFLNDRGMNTHGPASLTTFKLILAVVSAVLGGFLTFPGLRLAKMHTDALKYCKENPFLQMILHINFCYPAIICAMWCKPWVKNFLTATRSGDRPALVTEEEFDTIRVLLILGLCLLRVVLATTHFQAHLNMAHERMTDMRKESGRISNIDVKKLIARVYYYLCVVALQYLAPVLLLLFSVCCLKTLGGMSWCSFLDIPFPVAPEVVEVVNATASNSSSSSETVAYFTMSLTQLRNVFTPVWYQGIFSYICWWICSCWFITSVFGLVYYQYFKR
ncbi:transmembrane protein 161B-like [Lineus longissimus]|uniref:transmembrane protein 161B-like n=1 Tax=Lineus longissimus TaxID=88925 RepID=UPI002B4F2900